MSMEEMSKSIALINLHIFLKKILNDHILLKNGKIDKILNLKYNKNKKQIEIEYEKDINVQKKEQNISPKIFNEHKTFNKQNFINIWDKYVNNYTK